MRVSTFTLGALLLGALPACNDSGSPIAVAANRPVSPDRHRAVLEVTVDGPEGWESVLNNVENMQKALGADAVTIEVVGHAKGLGLLLATNEPMRERMRALHDRGVVFAACENTMKKRGVTKDDLLPFVTTVDSGVAEVVRKQHAGWAYLKGGG